MSTIANRPPFRSPRRYADPLIPEARARQRRRRLRALTVVLAAAAIGGSLYGLEQSGSTAPVAAGCKLGGCRLTLTAVLLPNPCELMTDKQAAGLLGTPILYHAQELPNGESTSPRLVRECTWKGAPLSKFGYDDEMLSLTIDPTTVTRFAQEEKTNWGRVVRLRGIGDAAFATTGSASFLVVREKNYELTLQTNGGYATQVEESFAKVVLHHLH